MNKRIVFCADGTWDGSTRHSNVYKLYKALIVGADQVPLYDDGYGPDGVPTVKLVGGAAGTRLWQTIKDGYAKIANFYEAGDQIFIFGFSRGAYTARSLAGMITVFGLPTKEFTRDVVDKGFHAYRDKASRYHILQELAQYQLVDATITMLGVWDTVGSLGIPSVSALDDPVLYGFLDTSLHPRIKNAYQALAIDERRSQFSPTLWQGPASPGQTLEQVWFTGAHCDVGGGEPDDSSEATALSDITLGWMMSKASNLGLEFDSAALKRYATPLGAELALDKFHESWKVEYGVPIRRTIPRDSCVANSVLVRCEHDMSYRPANLVFNKGALSSEYRMTLVVDGVVP
jgi:uncharacterized protein (DUF2235 family)